jgi:hypothetical protein
MTYTHVLCLKAWLPSLNCTTDYNNVESKIKQMLVNNEFTEMVTLDGKIHKITVEWKKHKWDNKFGNLISGDLVANITTGLPSDDQIIYKDTEIVLKKIEEKLKEQYMFTNDFEIIFNIVKPLSQIKQYHDEESISRH